MCLLSILNQQKKYGGNIYLSILSHYPIRDVNPTISAISKWKYLLLLKLYLLRKLRFESEFLRFVQGLNTNCEKSRIKIDV